MKKHLVFVFVAAAALAGLHAAAALAEQEPMRTLTLHWVSKMTYKTVGATPGFLGWSEDSRKIYFWWNPEKEEQPSLYWVSPLGGAPVKVDDSDFWKIPSGSVSRNPQGTLTVYEKFGDLFLYEIGSGNVTRLFNTRKTESNPHFLADGRRFSFESDGQVYAYDLKSAVVSQLTDIRPGSDPECKAVKSPAEDFLETQQESLFDIIQDRRKDRERAKEQQALRNPQPRPFYLGGKDKKVVNLVPAPDGHHVAFVVEDTSKSGQARVPEMSRYVTESGYVETEKIVFSTGSRVKVGAPVSSFRIGVYECQTGAVVWAAIDIDDKEVNYNTPVWSPDSSKIAFVAGSVDNKDRWIATFDPIADRTDIVDHEADEAWIRDLRAGRGNPVLGWLDENATLYFLSERNQWWHLFACDVTSKKATPLTEGPWEVDFVQLSKDKERFYLTTTSVHPCERHLFSMPARGGKLTRMTFSKGWHEPFISPDERLIALKSGDSVTPSELCVMDNRPGAEPIRLTDSTTPEFKSYPWPKPKIVSYPDEDGNMVFADLYLPPEGGEKKPAVIYVHGAGYFQGVYDRWLYPRLLQSYFVQQGYVVMCVDYRGSAGYGRECRTAVYRNMGDKDIRSVVEGVNYLVREFDVDPNRVGIFGESYGGFLTLMALFKHPGVFAAGVAHVPVTDWAHYNHGYVSRILNLPFDDAEAYERSSPIYHAQGLRDNLLIVDGMEDGNVLVQDTMRLVQRLIELEKDNWHYHVYPTEGHGLRQERSLLDFHKRLCGFFDRHVKEPS